jgi:DNA repair photolyase
MITGDWIQPAVIAPNRFVYKSLSNWALNIAVGCEHACRFCYVPSASTIKLGEPLGKLGVRDPDAEWGDYVFLRRWDEKAFVASVKSAHKTPLDKLAPDGNRAVILCSTTDAYQVIRNENRDKQAELQNRRQKMVRRALEIIGTESSLNVRILTRSPLARQDFDLMRQLGHRCMFGMSIPTLNNQLARIYEPKAPAPTARLETLKAAKQAGLNIYVAVAPTYPECDVDDMAATLEAIAPLDPLTVYMEPINIRAENVRRIESHAAQIGQVMNTAVFETTATWLSYALKQLLEFEALSRHAGIMPHQLHLWPDAQMRQEPKLRDWLASHWNKISYWPKAA